MMDGEGWSSRQRRRNPDLDLDDDVVVEASAIDPRNRTRRSRHDAASRRSLPLISRYAVGGDDDDDCDDVGDDYNGDFQSRRPGLGGAEVSNGDAVVGPPHLYSNSSSKSGGGGGGGYALSLACACAIWFYGGMGGGGRGYQHDGSRHIQSTLNAAMSGVPVLSRLVGSLGWSGRGDGGDGESSSPASSSSGKKDGGRGGDDDENDDGEDDFDVIDRPDFVYEHPYVSSSYYTSTRSIKTLSSNEEMQVRKNLLLQQRRQMQGGENDNDDGSSSDDRLVKTRLAIVRPFCEFDAEALPTTFTCWNALPPCKAASDDVGDYDNDIDDIEYEVGPDGELIITYNGNSTRGGWGGDAGDRHAFDYVGSDAMKYAKADVFLFYSQTYSENYVAIKAVDAIIDQFFEPGGWSQCFGNIYAIEANIPQELDLYIPSAQEELYNWVNGPNRQYEAAFRIIQSGEWGDYDGFYLMEGDSVPIKAHWLDVILSEIEVNRPFAVLGAQYDGDKWDVFYEKIPISLLHHTNGNAIYNTSHPLLERLVGQLEVEAPCPYNSIPYDYRMSQMWVEGTLGIVPTLAPKIMLNEEGENITLSNNTEMFKKWADIWEKTNPYKYTKAIHNYAATNLIPRHLGPEYVIHGAKLYSPWDPTKTEVTLVISEWFFDRSVNLIKGLDEKDHPFSEVVIMVPPVVGERDDYDQMTAVPVRTQHRGAPDFMDLCEAEVKTDWFMITNSYHSVARHVDLMFTPGTFIPVIPFTPATYAFCFKYPYCKETINLAQRIKPGHDKVILDMDMLYNTKMRNEFCKEWREANGGEGEDLYKHQQRRLMFRKNIIGPPGPTGTSYLAYLAREKKDGMYKLTDRSLYGARPPFIKVFAREEKLDGMSEEELAKRVGMTLLDNSTDCNCKAYETEVDCVESGIGCSWRPLFESCHPPELIDGGEPICSTTEAPTMSPTVSIELDDTDSPTADSASSSSSSAIGLTDVSDPWYISMFKSREHDVFTSEFNSTKDSILMADDDDAILDNDFTRKRKLGTDTYDDLYETELTADERINGRRGLQANSSDKKRTPLPMKSCNPWDPSIVPRTPTRSVDWDGPSIDPESRSFSAMATSRPRKLHVSFLRYQTLLSQEQQSVLPSIIGTSSPMKDSWLTSSVPINMPKYAASQAQEDTRANNIALEIPSGDHKTFVNYGQGDTYQPIRITFVTDHLLHSVNIDKSSTMAVITKIEALTGDILPSVSEIWAGAISVLRSVNNIFPFQAQCGEAKILPQHLAQGFLNTDTVIYVTIDGPRCHGGETIQNIVSYATVCSFDQHLRPISANIDICLLNMDLLFGEVSDQESLRITSALTKEVGLLLGLSPSLFQYFRNSETGQPFGSTEKTVTCVDGSEKTLLVPNILQPSLDLNLDAPGKKRGLWEVITPTVRQVIRNHFDCQSLIGARLSQFESPSCFGDSFDRRYHFDDDFTAIGGSADTAFSLTPLTLALLEDSGWYRANFEKSTVPLFGRGAGCGFVEGKCLGESKTKVPDYSQGFFCNDISQGSRDLNQPIGCDYTHNHKAGCSSFGVKELDGTVCPLRMADVTSCSDKTISPSLTGEMFSPNSRCFVTDSRTSVCLQSYCNAVDSKLDIVVHEKVFQCDYEGQELDLGHGYAIQCPRLAVVCPHLVCPANCSGKGVCDYCLELPVCVCDDPFNETPGCYSP